MNSQAPADWYPDPLHRFEVRYWDGAEWTEHVSTQGSQARDPLTPAAPPSDPRAKTVQRAVKAVGPTGAGQVGGGTIFTEPVLVLSQNAKLVEINAEYAIFDQHGRAIGAIREVGQSVLKKAVRADRYGSHRLNVIDMNGAILLTLTKPVSIVKLRVMARTADGAEVGEIVQKWASVLGKMTFALEYQGETVGTLNGEDLDSWDFNIQDEKGSEVARISKATTGLGRALSSKGDDYVIDFPQPLKDPLRSLVVAAALAIDTMLRQGN